MRCTTILAASSPAAILAPRRTSGFRVIIHVGRLSGPGPNVGTTGSLGVFFQPRLLTPIQELLSLDVKRKNNRRTRSFRGYRPFGRQSTGSYRSLWTWCSCFISTTQLVLLERVSIRPTTGTATVTQNGGNALTRTPISWLDRTLWSSSISIPPKGRHIMSLSLLGGVPWSRLLFSTRLRLPYFLMILTLFTFNLGDLRRTSLASQLAYWPLQCPISSWSFSCVS